MPNRHDKSWLACLAKREEGCRTHFSVLARSRADLWVSSESSSPASGGRPPVPSVPPGGPPHGAPVHSRPEPWHCTRPLRAAEPWRAPVKPRAEGPRPRLESRGVLPGPCRGWKARRSHAGRSKAGCAARAAETLDAGGPGKGSSKVLRIDRLVPCWRLLAPGTAGRFPPGYARTTTFLKSCQSAHVACPVNGLGT